MFSCKNERKVFLMVLLLADNFVSNQREWGKNLFVLLSGFLLSPIPPHPKQTDEPKML